MIRHLWKAGLTLVALTFVFGSAAQAQHGHHHGGIGQGVYSRGVNINGGYGNRGYGYNNYVQPRTSFYGNIGGIGFGYNNFNRRPVYHDTTHYDYHPGGFVPHGNHYDYIPGHYDLHNTGHYHW